MTVSREGFVEIAKQYFTAAGEQRPMRYDARQDQLVIGGDAHAPFSYVYLGHAYADYELAPGGEKAKVLARRFWSSVHTGSVPSLELLKASVLPQVRDRAWFSALRRRIEYEMGAEEAVIDDLVLPFHEVNGEVAAHLALELPTSVVELGNERLKAWGVDFDSLYAQALENLAARSSADFEQPEPGIFVSPYRDNMDASRMLLTGLFEKLAIKGKPVVVAPTQDILLCTGDEDEKGLATIAQWTEEALLEPRPHTAYAFRLEDGVWKTWLPQRGHAAWEKLRVLQLQSLASAYARQKDVLDPLLESNGHDIFVANVRAFKTQDGNIITACAWTDGVEALLPRVDRLDFVKLPPDGNTKNAQVWSTQWSIARETVGRLMEATGDVPERFRVAGFPTEVELKAMVDAAQSAR